MKRSFGVLSVIVVLLLTGCGTTGKFVYPANMTTLAKPGDNPINKKVAVLPFDDYRPDSNSNLFLMYLIPLMPFGWGNYSRPDAANMFLSIPTYDVTPSEDLAKATALSFRHSNLFRDVFFTQGGEKDNADFILKGKINEMKYHGKMFTYGLSAYGPIFWIFGAPAGMSDNKIAVELSLSNKEGKLLWKYSFKKEGWIVQWIYSRMGHDCKRFTNMYQEGMNAAVNDLYEKMISNPSTFQ